MKMGLGSGQVFSFTSIDCDGDTFTYFDNHGESYGDAPEKRPHCGFCSCIGCREYDRAVLALGPSEKAVVVLKIHFPNEPHEWIWRNGCVDE